MENAVPGTADAKPVEFILVHADRSWTTAIVRVPADLTTSWADAQVLAWFNKNVATPQGVVRAYVWDRYPEAGR